MNGVNFLAIHKKEVEAAAVFAAHNIPGIDERTLQKFLDLIDCTEEFGSITRHELLEKMRLFRKYIPGACNYSLLMLAELLDLTPAESLMAA